MKKFRKAIFTAVLVMVTAGMTPQMAYAKEINVDAASEEIVESGVMYLLEDSDAKAEPKTGAKTVAELKKGESIFVTEKTENNWYCFVKEGKEAYVECAKVETPGASPELQSEMQKHVENTVKDIERVNQYREQTAKSKIWGAVIVVLVIAIFAFGIVTTVKKDKKKKPEETE